MTCRFNGLSLGGLYGFILSKAVNPLRSIRCTQSTPKKGKNMKKILIIWLCLIFAANAGLAQEVFLSLTKYDEDIKELPTNVTVIEQKQIEAKHVETLGELLQNETSINFKSYGTLGSASSISIRGATAAQTLVLIDGRRVNDPAMGGTDFTSIPAVNIERVEIIRGAGASIYGTGAFGGVINVITKKAASSSPMVDAGISYGSFNTIGTNLTGAYADEKFAALAVTSLLTTDGSRNNSTYNNENFLFNGSVNLSEISTIALSANVFQSVYGIPGSKSYPTPNYEQQDNNRYAKADYSLLLGKGSLNVTAYASQNKRKAINPAWMSDTRYTNDTLGAQADFSFDKWLLFGAEWWQEDYKQEDGIANTTAENRDRVNTAAYAQLNLDLWKFRIITSVRGDSNSAYGDVATPAVSAVFSVNDYFKISGNCGKVWNAPSFTQLYSSDAFFIANPDLKVEEGISSDVGFEYAQDKTRLMATAFYVDTKNLIKNVAADPMDPFSPWTVANYDTKQYGAEVEAGYIMTAWMDHKVNYTYLKAENKDTGEWLTYCPQNTVNYTLTVKPVQPLSVSAIAYYRDSQSIGAGVPDLDGFFTLDLSVNYKVTDSFSCWVKGFNITNADYQLQYDYPMPGATVYGGINIKFWK